MNCRESELADPPCGATGYHFYHAHSAFDELADPLCGATGYRAFRPLHVHDENPATDEQQGDHAPQPEGLAAFIQQQDGENHTEHRVHESEDSDFGDRIILQQDSPYRVGDGGNTGEIAEHR